MAIIPLPITEYCNNCNEPYNVVGDWIPPVCPSCFIESLENISNYVAGCDVPQQKYEMYINVSPDEWFYVVTDKTTKYRVVSKRMYFIKNKKYGDIFYQNKLKECLKWIERKIKKD